MNDEIINWSRRFEDDKAWANYLKHSTNKELADLTIRAIGSIVAGSMDEIIMSRYLSVLFEVVNRLKAEDNE